MTLFARKLGTRRIDGCIEDRFEFLDKEYVRTRENPDSNRLPTPRITLFPITDPYERILAELVARDLYGD